MGRNKRGRGSDTGRRGLSGISVCFLFFLLGLHVNTAERIVQLRELKKMHNPGQGDGEGGVERGKEGKLRRKG